MLFPDRCLRRGADRVAPLVRPLTVRRFFEGQKIESYTDAVRAALQTAELHPARARCSLRTSSWRAARAAIQKRSRPGGWTPWKARPLQGSIMWHWGTCPARRAPGRPLCATAAARSNTRFQKLGSKNLPRLCLRQKGEAEVRALPLAPVRDLRVIRGSYMELTARETYRAQRGRLPARRAHRRKRGARGAGAAARHIPQHHELAYDNARTRAVQGAAAEPLPALSPEALFCELYERQNGGPMQPEQQEVLRQIVNTVWEEEA